MAIKIIKAPGVTFRIECELCKAILEYELNDALYGTVQCPCCSRWNDATAGKRLTEEREDTE